jgi:hypothetical protein
MAADDADRGTDSLLETVVYGHLIEAAADMLRDAQADDVPPSLFAEEEKLFRQLLELMVEAVDAIRVLCRHGLYRPAYAMLRTFVETTTKLVWISRDVPRRSEVFFSAKRHDMKKRLKEIGWEDEYERTYKALNHYIHADPRMSASGYYRTYEWGDDDLFPELGPETKYYFFGNPQGTA